MPSVGGDRVKETVTINGSKRTLFKELNVVQ